MRGGSVPPTAFLSRARAGSLPPSSFERSRAALQRPITVESLAAQRSTLGGGLGGPSFSATIGRGGAPAGARGRVEGALNYRRASIAVPTGTSLNAVSWMNLAIGPYKIGLLLIIVQLFLQHLPTSVVLK